MLHGTGPGPAARRQAGTAASRLEVAHPANGEKQPLLMAEAVEARVLQVFHADRRHVLPGGKT
jgi:hypothetical protein